MTAEDYTETLRAYHDVFATRQGKLVLADLIRLSRQLNMGFHKAKEFVAGEGAALTAIYKIALCEFVEYIEARIEEEIAEDGS